MTKTAALYSFFSQFDISAYPASAVPAKVAFPYLTYEVTLDDWGSSPVSIVANAWFHTESEREPNAFVDRVGDAIGIGGVMVSCEDGAIWIKRGSPFCVSLSDEADNTVKRKSMNLTLEFLTL